jgi:hypothetical protein
MRTAINEQPYPMVETLMSSVVGLAGDCERALGLSQT